MGLHLVEKINTNLTIHLLTQIRDTHPDGHLERLYTCVPPG